MPAGVAAGAVPSPNIWQHPATYELENAAVDPDRALETAMTEVADWTGLDVLDVGCGTGFHLPRWAERARTVTGVEPHPDLAAMATRRTRRLDTVTVLLGSATELPLADACVDWVQARWAYFFGPGCEPGLAELQRVVRPGGHAFVVDNDPLRPSTFSDWFRRGYPRHDAAAVHDFWTRQGWQHVPVDIRWRFEERADLEAVTGIELPSDVAEQVLAEHEGLEVDYAVALWWRRF
ncbi:class I SAM-dependent methyltransferase [Nocardioidaceae bacterium]|nr:class I SAM-dependent methyltransferase [Nocardioidaceae bacterium]